MMLTGSCTIYTEKQSEALSKVVYATKDSLDAARIDLADTYSIEATRIIKPPKNRIEIQSMYESSGSLASSTVKSNIKQRVVVIPEKYKHDIVVVVSSIEYQNLLKDKENFELVKKDHELLVKAKQDVDEELTRQAEFHDKMVRDLNTLQKKIAEKNLTILKLNCIIAGLVVALSVGGFLIMKGII